MPFPLRPSHRPLLFAHRGASAHAPENTLAAFKLAETLGADGIECDVQLSADGHLIIHHDRVLGRTEQARGRVQDLDFALLRSLDVGSWFDPAYRHERMPTPEELVDSLDEHTLINFDVVNDSPRLVGLEAAIVRFFRRLDLFDRAMVSSFNPLSLWVIRRMEPRITIGLIWADFLPWWLRGPWWRRWLRPDALHPACDLVTPELVAHAHARGQRVHVWTVNKPADIARMMARQVDMIMGDWVDRLRQAAEMAGQETAAPYR
ncbi:MAG: glycerophosphodiester phosphodiesterase [Caldilineae bacterium]|nr:MAG: glycerophosphodiester phosphodiesterase [Caldilineae bacterium]